MLYPKSSPSIGMQRLLLVLVMSSCWCVQRNRPFVAGVCVERESNKDVADFVPLRCNQDVIHMDTQLCTSWSNYFSAFTFTSRVVIPCGVCLLIAHNDDSMNSITLTFQDGLDIQGKLVILGHDDYIVTIQSTLIVVQGELVVNTTDQTVDGNARVRFILQGNQEQSFEPVEENALACDYGTQPCHIGKKAFVVAGGAVTFLGLPSSDSVRTWVSLQRVASLEGEDMLTPSVLMVEATVPWAAGAELLVTSHTREWDGQQVRRIRLVKPHPRNAGWVQLYLDTPLQYRPTTRQDNREMAVEVALLSRSIVVESGDDGSDIEQGGHFVVMHTPQVVQTVTGVEFRNLGQQGCLGRYSVHFHFLQNSTGSVISKNAIRGSHQRCIVVHGTDNLIVADNVAFDTKGTIFSPCLPTSLPVASAYGAFVLLNIPKGIASC